MPTMRAVTAGLLMILSSYDVVFAIPPGFERVPRVETESQQEHQLATFWMPKINTSKENEKYCMGRNLDFDMKYSIKTIPRIMSESVEEILIYGCPQPMEQTSETGTWSCTGGHPAVFACPNGRARILFSWSKNAPDLIDLPPGVGFPLGSRAGIKSVFMQIQYSSIVTEDSSGVIVALTDETPKYIGGIFLLAAGGQLIPPGRPEANVDVKCLYQDDVVIHPFAFRTHAHGLGVVISGWYAKPEGDSTPEWTMLGKQSPQNPQVFYPIQGAHNISKGTVLGARCVYNTSSRTSPTFMGNEETDEMCNFYFAYYAESSIQHDVCGDVVPSAAMYQLPQEANVRLPPRDTVTLDQADGIIPASAPAQNQENDLDTALETPASLFPVGGDNSSDSDTLIIVGLRIYSQSEDTSDDVSSTVGVSTEAAQQSYWQAMAGDSDLCLVLLILVIVLTAIVLSGGMILCIRQSKSRVAESKMKNLLYQIETNAKEPMYTSQGYAPMKA